MAEIKKKLVSDELMQLVTDCLHYNIIDKLWECLRLILYLVLSNVNRILDPGMVKTVSVSKKTNLLFKFFSKFSRYSVYIHTYITYLFLSLFFSHFKSTK